MNSNWRDFLGTAYWSMFLILLVLKLTGFDIEWGVVFLPFILPVVVSVFLILVVLFLTIVAGFVILGTIVVIELLEKFNQLWK